MVTYLQKKLVGDHQNCFIRQLNPPHSHCIFLLGYSFSHNEVVSGNHLKFTCLHSFYGLMKIWRNANRNCKKKWKTVLHKTGYIPIHKVTTVPKILDRKTNIYAIKCLISSSDARTSVKRYHVSKSKLYLVSPCHALNDNPHLPSQTFHTP